MKRIATSLLAGLLLIGIVGCSPTVEVKDQDAPASEEKETATLTPESERQPIQIVNSGYWIDDSGFGHYGVILENSNQGWAASNFSFQITGKDEQGNIVGNDTQYVTLLFANGKNGYGGQTTFTGAKTLEFQVVDNKNIWAQETTQQAELDKEFHLQNVHASVDPYNLTTVAGEVVNDTTGDTTYANVSALFMGADGSILGGCRGFVESSPAGSTVPFSIAYISDVPQYASVEAYIDFGTVNQ